jgi:protein TonB
VAALAILVVLPLLYFTDQLPDPPDMMAFVIDAPAPPPPPPPPPPPARPQAPQRREPVKPKAAPDVVRAAAPAPVEAPATITPDVLPAVPVQEFGGVEGGVPGGIAGGVVGGVPMMPPPPAPPPPPKPAKPVRVGGEIEAPTLVHRVNPEYPSIAVSGKIEGIVILEATVDERGAVEDVRVLRSHPLLDRAALDAVRQWRYKPLQLNGRATPFILTVTVSFNL